MEEYKLGDTLQLEWSKQVLEKDTQTMTEINS